MNGKKRTREIRDGVLYISCTRCEMMFPETNFQKRAKNGGGYWLGSMCKKCRCEYEKQRYAKKRVKNEDSARHDDHVKEQRQLLKEVNELFGGIENIPDSPIGGYQANICIDCQNACGGCSWTAVDTTKNGKPIKFEPVDGWEAELVYRKGNGGTIVKTYSVTACPEFVPDEPRKPQHIVDGK